MKIDRFLDKITTSLCFSNTDKMKEIASILLLITFYILSGQQNVLALEYKPVGEGGKKNIEIFSGLTDSSAGIANMQIEHEAEKNEKEIALLREKEKRHRAMIKFYFIIAFLIGVIAVINFLRYRSKKRAEEAIRESEQIYRELVERVNDGIAIVQDGEFKFVNPKITTILGYTSEEIIGKPFEIIVAPEEKERLKDIYYRRTVGEEVESKYETVLLHKNGRKVDVEINAGLISFNNRPATLAFAHNIGERKLLEEERIKRSKLEAVGSLAGGIAHDFNNLLAVILGNIELARLFPKSEKKLSAILTKAEKAALKARDLTKRFLTFSEGGAPFKKLVSLESIIKEAVDITVSGADTKFQLNIPSDLWEVRCDEEQIYQVFASLIANAAEAMEGEGVITIEADNFETESLVSPLKPGKYVKIAVKDKGEGIPAEHLSKIFDPYFSTRKRVSQKGLGFGLSIVYSIIQQHDGHIEVESKVKQGTTITIYLPVR